MIESQEFSTYAAARWPSLVRSAVVLGCDFEEARDLAQTTLLRCYVFWPKVQNARDRDGYVYRILLNCFRDSRRRRWWQEHPAESVPNHATPMSPDPAVEVALADAVHRAVAELTDGQRAVVMLRYFANLSEQQTSAVLGISPGTAKSRMSRALARMAISPHLAEHVEGDRS